MRVDYPRGWSSSTGRGTELIRHLLLYPPSLFHNSIPIRPEAVPSFDHLNNNPHPQSENKDPLQTLQIIHPIPEASQRGQPKPRRNVTCKHVRHPAWHSLPDCRIETHQETLHDLFDRAVDGSLKHGDEDPSHPGEDFVNAEHDEEEKRLDEVKDPAKWVGEELDERENGGADCWISRVVRAMTEFGDLRIDKGQFRGRERKKNSRSGIL